MAVQSALCIRGRLGARTIFFLALAAAWLAAAPASAGQPIFDGVIVDSGVDRQDGAIVDANPYFFEVCIEGPDISLSTLPTVQTPASANFPQGSEQTLEVDDGEFCFEQIYASAAARDADFPNGAYTVTASNIGDTATDSKQVSFTATPPTAYADITAPMNGGTVSSALATPVGWTLVDKGGCNLAAPASCLEFFVVGAFLDDDSADEDVDFQIIMDPGATGTSIPGGAFLAGSSYEIEVETLRGDQTMQTTDTLGQAVLVTQVSTDINAIIVMGEAPNQPIDEVLFFMGVDREDGVLEPNPYFIEVCIEGTDLPISPPAALPTVDTPSSVDFPLGTTQVMTPEGDEFCWEEEGFGDAQELADAYPLGAYTITATDNGQTTDTAVVNYDLSEPGGFGDFFDPMDGAIIDSDVDLDVQWSLNSTNGCSPGTPSTCTDGFLLFTVDENADNDVDTQFLPDTAGAAIVSATVLQPATLYGLELETYRGTIQAPETSDTLGNPIEVTMLFESINFISVTTVPEPGVAALRLAAFLALGAVARRRR